MSYKFVVYIGAQPERVWDALIQPEGTRKIFFDCVFQSELQPGSSFAYVGPGNDGPDTVHVYGEILEIEPGRMLSVREHPGPSYYENHAVLASRIVYTLEKAGECTKMTLINDQYTENHPSYAKTEETWPVVLSNLKSYIETGNTLNLGW